MNEEIKKIDSVEHVTVSSSVLANLFGLSTRRIRQLEEEGVINKVARGKYSLQENIKSYITFIKTTVDLKENKGEELKIDYDEEHALLEKAKREKAELEVALMQGKLHDAVDVEREMTKMLSAFRAKILAIPSKMAPQLIAQTEISIIENILETEVYNALTELSKYDPEVFQNDKYVGELELDEDKT